MRLVTRDCKVPKNLVLVANGLTGAPPRATIPKGWAARGAAHVDQSAASVHLYDPNPPDLLDGADLFGARHTDGAPAGAARRRHRHAGRAQDSCDAGAATRRRRDLHGLR